MNTGCLSKFDVLSLNVRGIRDQIKRRSIFSYLKDQKANIYFLQETHSQRAHENIWRNEWGGELFFSHGTTHSKRKDNLWSLVISWTILFWRKLKNSEIWELQLLTTLIGTCTLIL